MNTPHHRQFLLTNQLSIADLAEPLRAKLKTYDLIESMVSETIDEDRESLTKRLRRLDFELTDDLFLEFFSENIEEPEEERIPEVAKRQPSGDESILIRLWEQGRRAKIPLSVFIREGIKTPISGNNVQIGPFLLRKTGVFTNEYSLESMGHL